MATAVKKAYPSVFTANEYAYKLSREELNNKLISLLGASKTDPNIPAISGTLTELFKLSKFEQSSVSAKKISENPEITTNQLSGANVGADAKTKLKLGLSYTINLNLPATTDIQVFNAIFKSLKENILDHE